jgi:hypothetical protein
VTLPGQKSDAAPTRNLPLHRRLRLFVRDYLSEFPVAWSIARTRDCERAGGHRWSATAYDETIKGWGQECSRCGCWQSAPTTAGTGCTTVWVNPPSTTQTGESYRGSGPLGF